MSFIITNGSSYTFNNIFTITNMDFLLLHLYLASSLFTTIAFFYLIFHFFVSSRKKTCFDQLPTQELQCFNDNIAGLITNLSFNQTQETQQKLRQSSALTSTAKKIINNRKQRNFCKDKHHRQCYFLPSSDLGLIRMKIMNKKYMKNSQNAGCLALMKQKKKKNLSYCVKKYGFHKTTLVTIYEQLQY